MIVIDLEPLKSRKSRLGYPLKQLVQVKHGHVELRDAFGLVGCQGDSNKVVSISPAIRRLDVPFPGEVFNRVSGLVGVELEVVDGGRCESARPISNTIRDEVLLMTAAQEEVDKVVESLAEVVFVDEVSEAGVFEGVERVAVEESCGEVEPVFVDKQKGGDRGGW